jgi:GAF domain-containing protein
MNTQFDSILHQITECLKNPAPRNAKLEAICHLLKDEVGHYDWVGFYLVDAQNRRELVLGPYAGKPTEHTRILFGAGICGQAAERKSTFVVQDVARETNYLSCSPEVKSEIVVPIFKGGEIAGELDIDSYQISPFTERDWEFLEKVCALVSGVL